MLKHLSKCIFCSFLPCQTIPLSRFPLPGSLTLKRELELNYVYPFTSSFLALCCSNVAEHAVSSTKQTNLSVGFSFVKLLLAVFTDKTSYFLAGPQHFEDMLAASWCHLYQFTEAGDVSWMLDESALYSVLLYTPLCVMRQKTALTSSPSFQELLLKIFTTDC